MICRMRGTVCEVAEQSVILEIQDICHEVLIPAFCVGEFAVHRGKQMTVHTHEFLEGNSNNGNLTPRLIGFTQPQDRAFFYQFVSVKGVGPRKALKALAEPIAQIANWISAGDQKALSKLPGIGPRAAQVLIAELSGKIDEFAHAGAAKSIAEIVEWSDPQRDAIEIMVSWGDNRPDVERWLERASQLHPSTSSADDWVRACYRIRSGAEG